MAVLLAILKVLGIILAALVAVILLAALYLLFLPVHVKIFAACDPSPDFRIRVLGFLHFFQIGASYREGKTDWSAAAFWGKWILAPKKASKNAGAEGPGAAGDGAGENVRGERTQASRASTGEARISREPPALEEPRVPQETSTSETSQAPREPETPGNRKPTLEPGTSGNRRPTRDPGTFGNRKPTRDTGKSQEQKRTGQRNAGKKRTGRREPSAAGRLRDLGSGLPDASQRRAFSFLIREGLAYLKKICPHLAKADADYSLGDPAWTGELTGIISLWPGVYGKNIYFRPDFESDGIYFHGYVQLESEVYFWQIALLLLKIYRNEDCRRLFDL